MKKIDAHAHVFDHIGSMGKAGELRPLGNGNCRWATGEEFRIIPEGKGDKEYLVETFMDVMDENDVEKAIRAINPRAPIIPTTQASVRPGLLFSMEDDTDVLRVPEPEAATVIDHRDRLSKDPDTDIHSQGIISFTVQLPGIFDPHRITRYLDQIPDSVYRLKGVVRIAGMKQAQLLQYVSGRYELTNHYGSGIEPNTLVFIGRDMNREELQDRLRKCLADA